MIVGGGAAGNASNPYAADYRFVYHGDDPPTQFACGYTVHNRPAGLQHDIVDF